MPQAQVSAVNNRTGVSVSTKTDAQSGRTLALKDIDTLPQLGPVEHEFLASQLAAAGGE